MFLIMTVVGTILIAPLFALVALAELAARRWPPAAEYLKAAIVLVAMVVGVAMSVALNSPASRARPSSAELATLAAPAPPRAHLSAPVTRNRRR